MCLKKTSLIINSVFEFDILQWDRCNASETGAFNLLLQNLYDDEQQNKWTIIKESTPVCKTKGFQDHKTQKLPLQAGTEQSIN